LIDELTVAVDRKIGIVSLYLVEMSEAGQRSPMMAAVIAPEQYKPLII
jgi:hypothetical protein